MVGLKQPEGEFPPNLLVLSIYFEMLAPRLSGCLPLDVIYLNP